jgi:hypothetical protein
MLVSGSDDQTVKLWTQPVDDAWPRSRDKVTARHQHASSTVTASNQQAAPPLILIARDAFVETTAFITSMCISSTETILM